ITMPVTNPTLIFSAVVSATAVSVGAVGDGARSVDPLVSGASTPASAPAVAPCPGDELRALQRRVRSVHGRERCQNDVVRERASRLRRRSPRLQPCTRSSFDSLPRPRRLLHYTGALPPRGEAPCRSVSSLSSA